MMTCFILSRQLTLSVAVQACLAYDPGQLVFEQNPLVYHPVIDASSISCGVQKRCTCQQGVLCNGDTIQLLRAGLSAFPVFNQSYGIFQARCLPGWLDPGGCDDTGFFGGTRRFIDAKVVLQRRPCVLNIISLSVLFERCMYTLVVVLVAAISEQEICTSQEH